MAVEAGSWSQFGWVQVHSYMDFLYLSIVVQASDRKQGQFWLTSSCGGLGYWHVLLWVLGLAWGIYMAVESSNGSQAGGMEALAPSVPMVVNVGCRGQADVLTHTPEEARDGCWLDHKI